MKTLSVLALILLAASPVLGQRVLHHLDGAQAGLRLGTTVIGLHDLDLDGAPEFAAATGQDRVDVFDGATGLLRFSIAGPLNADFGTALAALFDADLDGVADIAIGAPAIANAALPGSVFIHSGFDGSLIRVIVGTQPGEQFGCALEGYGDLDGNGIDDLVIGASHHDKAGIQDCGAVYIHDPSTGNQLLQIVGDFWNDSFGAAIAVIDDLNADGLPELAVGAPLGNQTGTIVGLYGGSGQVVLHGSGGSWNPITTLYGQAADDFHGSALAALGDIDGDGFPELAIGIPGHDSALGSSVGRVEIRSLPWGQLVQARDGQASGDRYGDRLAALGDVDGDLLVDLGVGAPNAGPSAEGRLEVIRALDGQLVFQGAGTGPFENLGASIAALEDFGNDGVREFLFSASGASGAAFFGGRVESRSHRLGVYGAAARGGSNPILGAQQRPLRIDGGFGGFFDGRVEIAIGQAFTLGLEQPQAMSQPANFVLWAAFGIPAATEGEDLPYGLGRLVIPTAVMHPGLQPWLFTLVDGFGLGLPALVPAGPTPFVAMNPGIGFPLEVTIQGLIEEQSGVLAPTNALVLVVD